MQARIIGIRQELSFESGESANYMLMELPNGSHIQAPIDDDTLRELTVSFVNDGSPAAEQAVAHAHSAPPQGPEYTKVYAEQRQDRDPEAHPALARTAKLADVAKEDSYTPLGLQDDADFEFGGNFQQGGQSEEDLEVLRMQQQFHQAAERVEQAASIGSVQDAARELGRPGNLPVPSWAAEGTAQTKAKMRTGSHVSPVALAAVTVRADEKGNPVLHGEGLVDPYTLTGPTDEAYEAAQL